MPNSDLPDLDVRLDHLEQYKNQINEHSIIIGHSLGAPTAIQLLQKWNQPIERLILIAPTHTDINWDEYNQKVPSYNNEQIQKVSQTPTDWEQIQSLVHHIDAFFSEDDPYISMQVQDFYERDLGAKAQVFTDK
ncbi:MAG: alpha/beta fold hydrolase [bacterium]